MINKPDIRLLVRVCDNLSTKKEFKLTEILSDEEIEAAWDLPAREISKHIVRPKLSYINRKLGQENDPLYIAYCIEYAILLAKRSESK